MRFIFGNAPVVQGQSPVAEGWRQIPALGAKSIQTYGLIVSCIGMLLVGVLLGGSIKPSSTWTAILILIITLPLHELVHALTTPAWGLSDRTVIGLQRSKGLVMPYMTYDGSQPLWHMLLTGLAPLILLTVLPLIIIVFSPLNAALRADLSFLAFFNIAISGGDLVNFYWIATHLPMHATVKGDGWGLLWKD